MLERTYTHCADDTPQTDPLSGSNPVLDATTTSEPWIRLDGGACRTGNGVLLSGAFGLLKPCFCDGVYSVTVTINNHSGGFSLADGFSDRLVHLWGWSSAAHVVYGTNDGWVSIFCDRQQRVTRSRWFPAPSLQAGDVIQIHRYGHSSILTVNGEVYAVDDRLPPELWHPRGSAMYGDKANISNFMTGCGDGLVVPMIPPTLAWHAEWWSDDTVLPQEQPVNSLPDRTSHGRNLLSADLLGFPNTAPAVVDYTIAVKHRSVRVGQVFKTTNMRLLVADPLSWTPLPAPFTVVAIVKTRQPYTQNGLISALPPSSINGVGVALVAGKWVVSTSDFSSSYQISNVKADNKIYLLIVERTATEIRLEVDRKTVAVAQVPPGGVCTPPIFGGMLGTLDTTGFIYGAVHPYVLSAGQKDKLFLFKRGVYGE